MNKLGILLLQINNCALLGTCPSLVANVGAVRKTGIESAAQWRIFKNWTTFAALSYGESRYLDDYQFNLENLTDRDYIATVGQSGFSANDPTGANTYVQVGAPRMGFVSVEGIF